MAKVLTKNQQEVWDRLKYGLPPTFQTVNVAGQMPVLPITGSVVFNTADARMYLFDGCAWKAVA